MRNFPACIVKMVHKNDKTAAGETAPWEISDHQLVNDG